MTQRYQQPRERSFGREAETGHETHGRMPQSRQGMGQQPRTGREVGGQSPMGGQQIGEQPSMRGQGMQGPMSQRQGTQERQQVGGQQSMGQQPQAGRTEEEVGAKPKFEDHLSSDVMLVLADFQRLETTAEWCADQCVERGPELGTCARTCRDVADIAHLGVQLMSRNPYRRIDVGEVMLNTFLDAREELGQYRYPPVMDTVQVLDRAIESLSKGIETARQQGVGVQ